MSIRSYYLVTLCTISICICSCQPRKASDPLPLTDKTKQQAIIDRYLVDSAHQHSYYSFEWDYYINKGLAQDSTIAYLWQQKAMPLFKQGKYELGMSYLDKAVHYDEDRYLDYRAFIKCIFAKTYREALVDFERCLSKNGDIHVMDHPYTFYMALCYLQLNEFARAEPLLKANIYTTTHTLGEEWVHHIELFYYGIALYERRQFEEAVAVFDRALYKYPQFSDALYYKAHCLAYLGDYDTAQELINTAKTHGLAGHTINESNAIYERYPYQVRWH